MGKNFIIERLCASLVKKNTLVAFLFFAVSISPLQSYARDNLPQAYSWQPTVATQPAIPPNLVVVDKKRQQFYLFKYDSQLEIERTFICSTGQMPGDKTVEGDLKTPEGVYFVVQHLNSGLNFDLYGKEAYTLNYPNPADKLRKKTGYGIWIHGKGQYIAPLQTQGCVALNSDDLSSLSYVLKPGVPVVLSSTFAQKTDNSIQNVKTVNHLLELSKKWSDAWANRSLSFFTFYDANAYSITTESFSSFRSTKERLFKSLPWIKSTISDIHVLQGPDYWVTWFYQIYEAPNLKSDGIRRLYWKKDSDGDFKILGMEWAPGLSSTFFVAMNEKARPEVEINPKTENREIFSVNTEDTQEAPSAEPVDKKENSAFSEYDVKHLGSWEFDALKNIGQTIAEIKENQFQQIVEPQPAPNVDKKFTNVALQKESTTETSGSDSALFLVSKQLEAWRTAWQNGIIADYISYYDPQAVQDNKKGVSSIRLQKSSVWRSSPPKTVLLKDIKYVFLGDTVKVEFKQSYQSSTGLSTKGNKVLVFKKINEKWLIVEEKYGSYLSVEERKKSKLQNQLSLYTTKDTILISETFDFSKITESDANQGKKIQALTITRSEVVDLIEKWREAWERGDLEAYMKFYAKNAHQDTKFSAFLIRSQKEILWNKVAPKKIVFENITFNLNKTEVKVKLHQIYENVVGKKDFGEKTLVIKNIEGLWLITDEQWRPLP